LSHLWKEEPNCSEAVLAGLASTLALELGPTDRIFLEGPMGAGKTTFARALIEALGVSQPPEGSPSFAIAHEYYSKRGEVIHIDFYRIKDETEIDDAGIPSYFWERQVLVICEWLSLWPVFQASIIRSTSEPAKIWRIQLDFSTDETRRAVKIEIL